MRLLRLMSRILLLAFLAPLVAHAVWWMTQEHASSWATADWSSAGLLPVPAAKRDALVHVYGARTGRWKGIFAHHTWIVIKDAGASRYQRYDVTGWGRPVKENNWAPDARWFGSRPELIGAVEGGRAEALIPKVRAAIARYPHNGFDGYRIWPGPNSNTFTAHVLAAIPEAGITLPPTAIGKDWRTDGHIVGRSLSGSGWQFSLGGMLGITLGRTEGIELNVLGLVAGLDLAHPALKLPGFGRVGL